MHEASVMKPEGWSSKVSIRRITGKGFGLYKRLRMPIPLRQWRENGSIRESSISKIGTYARFKVCWRLMFFHISAHCQSGM
jgi:hypothetical protein